MACGGGFTCEQIEEFDRLAKEYEAMLCALLNVIMKEDTGDSVIMLAEKDGECKIRDFWENHQRRDRERIKASLNSSYSRHELAIIKELLT